MTRGYAPASLWRVADKRLLHASVMYADEPDIKGQMNPYEKACPGTANKQPASGTTSTEAEVRFDACFRAHYPEVLAYAQRRVGERGMAEDVAAQTFAVAWRRLSVLPGDPLPWLFGVARQVIRNETRSA